MAEVLGVIFWLVVLALLFGARRWFYGSARAWGRRQGRRDR